MDDDEEALAYDAMDFSEADVAFAERAASLVEARGGAARALRIVDLGCGTGTIALLLAERLPTAQIVGVDLADSMLAIARKKVLARALDARIELVRRDVKATELDAGAFDLVLSNSTMHHLPDPERLLREMKRLAAPGGALLLCDLFRPEDEAAAWRIVDAAAPNDSERQRRLFFDSLRAALTVSELAALVSAEGLRDVSVETISERHLAVSRRGTPRHDPEALAAR